MRNISITEIENEYKRIDLKWLKLHYITCVGLAAFGFVVECILGIALYQTGNIEIGLMKYLLKYLIAPFVCNAAFIVTCYWAVHSLHIAQNIKIYIVSLMFVAVCFVMFTVHAIFSSLFLIFMVPILLTVVYSDYALTTTTSIVSILAYAVSAVFIIWDPDKANMFESDYGTVNFVASLCILLAFFAACLVVIYFECEKKSAVIVRELERLNLRQKLVTDELTSISNRTALRNALGRMVVDRSEKQYLFVMSDLDNFKMLNDRLGHNIGDRCLKIFAGILKADCINATPFRYGGDEFCILFINQTQKEVLDLCRKIQTDLTKALADTGIDIPLTASFGIANYEAGMEVARLVKNADTALYYAKQMKNAVHLYNGEHCFPHDDPEDAADLS